MGRSRTPKYSVEVQGTTRACWWVKVNGPPSEENLAKYVQGYIDSLKSGGVNCHISKSLGYMPIPNWARITVNDAGRAVVVEWHAPLFMAI